ncbi:diguanylate cyclase [Sedimentibacter sp.]|uniref:HD-GYP domain-containing protein n=1 Tax=Sedimentibacter sp. TaxID=1960295 RepID=UPI0028AF8292|nr:diguanylate cyclase [Sedimentibacter sp.]
MDYPIFDFCLKFKIIYNKKGNFIDYLLMHVSDTFFKATNIDPKLISGKKFSDIVVDNADMLNFKEIYLNMIPSTKQRYDMYFKNLDRWYRINIYTDKGEYEDFLVIYYVDVTDIKNNNQQILSEIDENNKIIYLKDREKIYYGDRLTGLYNKNFFEEELLRLDTKRQLPISLIMGDINGLKLINDAFGHGMGDNALKKAAEIMTQSFRDEDIISRVGGDEFIVLLPKTSEETAKVIADRIKSKCESSPLDFIKISISFGVATKTEESEDIQKIFKKAEDRMYFKKLKESKEAKLSMIKFLKSRLEKITYETRSHYDRLKALTMLMANALKLSDSEKEELRLLCEFHDIGKIGVSKNILQKEGTLNNEEWENVKRHSEIGYYIAREFRDAKPIDELILIHHERWDGKGYPGLFKESEIPIVARVFAIADAYDVMVNDRPYKSLMSKYEALNEIRAQAGKQFDPYISKLFIGLMENMEQIV